MHRHRPPLVAAALDRARRRRLRDEQPAREQDQERHDRLEDAGRADVEQDRADQAADRAGGAQPARAPALAGSSLAVGERAADVAGEQRDVVGDVGRDARIADREQRRKRDQRAAAGDRVDAAGEQPGAAEQHQALPHPGGPSPPPTRFLTRRRRARRPVIALTFDDGPDPEHTPRILDLLGERGVRATFFVFGVKARRNRELIARALEAGHAVQPHCWADHESHLRMSGAGDRGRDRAHGRRRSRTSAARRRRCGGRPTATSASRRRTRSRRATGWRS